MTMHKSSHWRLACAALFAVAGLISIDLLSTHPYEWMLGESTPGQPPLTYCTLPSPGDSVQDVGLLVTCTFVLIGLLTGTCWRRQNAGRAFFLVTALLGFFAFYRFYLRAVLC